MSQISNTEIDPWDEVSALNRSRDRDRSYERGHESTTKQEKVWTDEEIRQWCAKERERLRKEREEYRARERAGEEYCHQERKKRRTPLW